MATAKLTDQYHLSLSIGKSLWDDLVGAALPLKVKDGTFDLGSGAIRRALVSGTVFAVCWKFERRQRPW